MLKYLAMSLDPIHPGVGGYRLGRVDNTIARDPGTNIPKIPGSGIHGAVRAYAAYALGRLSTCGRNNTCHNADCRVCYTFGATEVKSDNGPVSYRGVVRIYDAETVLFPVPTKHGPAWVTTPELLYKHFHFWKPKLESSDKAITTIEFRNGLNLGPLMFPQTDVIKKTFAEISKNDGTATGDSQWNPSLPWRAPLPDIQESLAIVHPSIFSQIVNRNLEVRTSVSIDAETGAAKENFLFTSEAIPAMTFFALPLVLHEFADEKRRGEKNR